MTQKRPPFKKMHETSVVEEQYLDLGLTKFSEEFSGAEGVATEGTIKIAEIYRLEDVKSLSKMLYSGHILLIDYSHLAGDEMAMKRITDELQYAIRDTQGDMAAVGKNMMLVTSKGVSIDRHKIRGSF